MKRKIKKDTKTKKVLKKREKRPFWGKNRPKKGRKNDYFEAKKKEERPKNDSKK